MPQPVRYTIHRAECRGRKKPLNVDCKTLDLAKQYARHRLSAVAEILEYDLLPLGCEAISRVGRIDVDGKVTWRRERRRKSRRYLSDELTK